MSTAIKKRNLVLTLDAFGTLIKPRKPILDQYKEEAAKFGVQFKTAVHIDAMIAKEFKTAFSSTKHEYPNYGCGLGSIGYEKWWNLVVERTLGPHITGPLPKELAPALLKRFSSAEGYEPHNDVLPFLRSVSSKNPPWRYPPLVTIPPDGPTPPQDTPMTIFGVLSNGDSRIPQVLDALGISKYFSFQLVSYEMGHAKPSREAFRLARLKGLRLAKGEPLFKIKDPLTGEELRKKWQGWDFIHVGDAIFDDWLAARKIPDYQPVWLDRDKEGLYGADLEKFRKRCEDKLPLQMVHMAEGMKGWAEKKLKGSERWNPMRAMGDSTKSRQAMHELLNSTITDLTELPSLFGEITPPPESEDGAPLSRALADPDTWDEELQKWRKEKTRVNLESQEVYSHVSQEGRKRWYTKQLKPPTRQSKGHGKHSRGSTRGKEGRSGGNVQKTRGSTWRSGKKFDENVERSRGSTWLDQERAGEDVERTRGSTWRSGEKFGENVERTQGRGVGQSNEEKPRIGLAYRLVRIRERWSW